MTETFYWDMNDGTRAFSKRFSARMKNKAMPSMVQAGVYASRAALSESARRAGRQSA